MAYTPINWQTGDVITAEKLNHMDDGIAEGGGGGVTVVTITIQMDPQSGDETYTTDKTYAELSDVIENGGYVSAYLNDEGYIENYCFETYSPAGGLSGYVGFTKVVSEPSGVKIYYININSDGSVTRGARG